jgi:protein SCO1/2
LASTAQRVILIGLGLALAGAFVTWRNLRTAPQPPGEIRTVTEFDDKKPLPDFRLQGTNGEFGNVQLQGRWSFLFFGYTQCPDVCPTALGLMKSVKEKIADASGAVPPGLTFQVVFVSVDPARDTPSMLKGYMAAFDPAFIGVTGDDAALGPMTKDLGVFYQRNDATDKKHYTVDHSAAIYLVDPAGRLSALFSHPQNAEKMAADFRRIAAQ